MRLYIENEKKK